MFDEVILGLRRAPARGPPALCQQLHLVPDAAADFLDVSGWDLRKTPRLFGKLTLADRTRMRTNLRSRSYRVHISEKRSCHNRTSRGSLSTRCITSAILGAACSKRSLQGPNRDTTATYRSSTLRSSPRRKVPG